LLKQEQKAVARAAPSNNELPAHGRKRRRYEESATNSQVSHSSGCNGPTIAALLLSVPVIILLTGPIVYVDGIDGLSVAACTISIGLLLSLVVPQLDILTSRRPWAIPVVVGLGGLIVLGLALAVEVIGPGTRNVTPPKNNTAAVAETQ